MKPERVVIGSTSVALLVALALGGTVAVPTPADQQQLPTVEDAPGGTIFAAVERGGEQVRRVGILKRGRTGGALYNPSIDAVSLRPGDVLVDREGRRYRMTIHQSHPGSAGVVGSGATLYPGETGLWFVGFSERQLDRFPRQATGGEVFLLDGGVPVDQRPGIYRRETAATREVLDVEERLSPELHELTVREPRVTELRAFDSRGEPVEPGSTVSADGFVVVSARVNFLDGERAQIHLFDPETETTITRGALSRATAMARFPERAVVIERTVPAGKARLEGPDGTIRSLANDAHQPTTRVYLVQDLGVVEEPGPVEVVVAADTHAPFGDLYSTGVRRSMTFTVEPPEAEVVAGTATPGLTTIESPSTPPPSPTTTTTTTTTTATTTVVTTTDQPGFGVLVAVVALLIAAIARSRLIRRDGGDGG